MPDPLDYMDALARRARMEADPQGDAAPGVLRKLRVETAPIRVRPVLAFACATLLFSAVLLGSIAFAQSGGDPLVAYFETQLHVSPWGWS